MPSSIDSSLTAGLQLLDASSWHKQAAAPKLPPCGVVCPPTVLPHPPATCHWPALEWAALRRLPLAQFPNGAGDCNEVESPERQPPPAATAPTTTTAMFGFQDAGLLGQGLKEEPLVPGALRPSAHWTPAAMLDNTNNRDPVGNQQSHPSAEFPRETSPPPPSNDDNGAVFEPKAPSEADD
ncbi:hypothetical protein QR680_019113 [Steinernema hermaphroditum]|uniref:Uncharacterized protein n=1 Tax=Steinernema hermaphroditum TaxID=289476 RepID=A0AA39HJZ2_9BILA|nr:hypothetical protein QR680_019113 [Steinernema hermaphroditum]